MPYKLKIAIALVIFIVISYLDYQYFSEAGTAGAIAPVIRQMMHLVILIMFIPVGFWVMKSAGHPWLKNLWLAAYGGVILLLCIIGFIQWKTALFSTQILDLVSKVRLFFTSPLLFVLLLFISGKIRNDAQVPANAPGKNGMAQ